MLRMLLTVALLMAMIPAQAGDWDGAVDAEPLGAEIVVYRSPTCGCCKKWLDHLEHNGFRVEDQVTDRLHEIKFEQQIPEHLVSCHTALVDGYVIEGHVPAEDIKRLLRERPAMRGLAVPNMPVGSPGMEVGSRKDPFSVIAFDGNGGMLPYSEYRDY